jgi:hypothetical protein
MNNLYKTDAEIVNAIERVGVTGKTFQSLVTRTALSIAMRWVETGDVQTAVNHAALLISKMPMGTRRLALAAWFEAVGGWTYDDESFVYDGNKTTITKERIVEYNQAKKRWFDLTQETAPTAFNFKELLVKLIERAEKRTAKTEKIDTIDGDMLAAAKALVQAA